MSDVESAHAAGSIAVGYANKPSKRTRLVNANAVIDTMADLVFGLGSATTARS